MAALRKITLKWDIATGKIKCSTCYLKREERVDIDLYITNDGDAYALPTGWALNMTVKPQGLSDNAALVAITSWATTTTGLYQATTAAISSADLDTYLEINNDTEDDVESKYVDVDVYYTESAAMRAKSDTLNLTLKPDVGQADDGTPIGTAVGITGSGYTMSTARLLGRTTAGTGAIEEISVGAGLTLASGTLSSNDAGAVQYDEAQALSDSQQTTARKNIGITNEQSFLVPVHRHAATPNGETLGMMITHDNFASLDNLFAGDLFVDPDNNGLRDPNLIRWNGYWYCIYTSNAWADPSNKLGLVRSENLQTWSFVGYITVTEALRVLWAPKWFVDPRTGKLHISVSFDPVSAPGGYHIGFIGTPTDDTLLTWTWSEASGLPSTLYDFQLSSNGKDYYAVGVIGSTPNNFRIYTASAIDGAWSLFSTPDIDGENGEQCWLTWMGGERWRFLYFDNPNRKFYLKFSKDGMATWGSRSLLWTMDELDQARGFVQIIDLHKPSHEYINADIVSGGSGFSGDIGNATGDSLVLDSGAAPSGQQFTIEANGLGGLGALVYEAGNIQIYFDAEYTGGGILARSTSAAILQKNGNNFQVVGSTTTPNGAWSPDNTMERFVIDVTTGAISLKGNTTVTGTLAATTVSATTISGDSVACDYVRLPKTTYDTQLLRFGADTYFDFSGDIYFRTDADGVAVATGGGQISALKIDKITGHATCRGKLVIGDGAGGTTTHLSAPATGTLRITSDGSTLGAVETGTINGSKLVVANSTTLGIGVNSLPAITSGIANTIVGTGAGDAIASGAYNTGIGRSAMTATTGSFNSAIGARAMLSNTSGGYNQAFGLEALFTNSTGSYNTALGHEAGYTTTGSHNVFVGNFAGKHETGSDAFYVDAYERSNTAEDKAKALIYGTFHSTTAASQTITINAGVVKLPHLPTSDPGVAGQLWNNGGVLMVSAG